MKKIDYEAHFYTKDYVKFLYEYKGYPHYVYDEEKRAPRMCYTAEVGVKQGDILVEKLLDMGKNRLKEMDGVGVDMQALSLSEPGCELFDPEIGSALAKETNDALSEAIKRYPDRFIGFAALAPKEPEGAVNELERTVRDLGFKGWKTHSNYGETYLDDRRYWPVLEQAEKLDVPVYLHPAFPAITQLHTYGWPLAAAPFGFAFETAMCLMRMILAGLFDQYPRLKIILGHLGETLPFLMSRIDYTFDKYWFDPSERPDLKRKPSEVLRENVFVTTSGMYYEPAFMCTYQAMGIERILLGTDYPYEDGDECMQFVEGLPISEEERDKIYYSNAERWGLTPE